MGAVIEIADARAERRRRNVIPDFFVSTPAGECEGCRALRNLVSVTHDKGSRRGEPHVPDSSALAVRRGEGHGSGAAARRDAVRDGRYGRRE